jgi:hypothetical protein
LYDEDGKTVIDSKFLGRGFIVECDVELDMDRNVVQVRTPPLGTRPCPYAINLNRSAS